jgi:hypothetical protein
MTRVSSYRRKSIFQTRIFDICCFLLVVLIISIILLYFTRKDFATELQQVRQPKPNHFYIGIDVSQTIKPETLAAFKKALILRLRDFIGDKEVFYHISVFGLPGCGREAIADVVSTHSPKDTQSFKWRVEQRIKDISIAINPNEEDKTPLTTPLHYFLEKILTERTGGRVIIISDLVNDDGGCGRQYRFPLRTILKFGSDIRSQIIFLYPDPYLSHGNPAHYERLRREQENFLMQMQRLSSDGKVRAFYYHIPSNPQKRMRFFRYQLKKCIPSTIFEVIWERVSNMIDTIIGAVRG